MYTLPYSAVFRTIKLMRVCVELEALLISKPYREAIHVVDGRGGKQ